MIVETAVTTRQNGDNRRAKFVNERDLVKLRNRVNNFRIISGVITLTLAAITVTIAVVAAKLNSPVLAVPTGICGICTFVFGAITYHNHREYKKSEMELIASRAKIVNPRNGNSSLELAGAMV